MATVNDIVETCGDTSVCQLPGASISNASELQRVLPDGVQVIVIEPPDVSSTHIANSVKQSTGADTVIVIEDHAVKDRFGVASNQDSDSIFEALYGQGQNDGGLAVAGIADTLVPSSPVAPTPGNDEGFSLGGLSGGALIAVVAMVVIGGTIIEVVHRVRKKNRAGANGMSARRLEKELGEALDGEDGRFLREAIEQLDERARALPQIGTQLTGLRGHISELFVRVRKRGTDQQIRLLQAKYKDTLTKLLKALSDDYYGDIVRNPRFWSNPESRLADVQRAIGSVDSQAVENIMQVNESRDLEFQVALDSLIKSVDEARLSDVYSDREP